MSGQTDTTKTTSSAVLVSLEGSIAVSVVLIIVLPILTAARFWVLRHNTRTKSRLVSDCFYIAWNCLIVVAGGLLFTNMNSELKNGPAAVTEPYMKNVFTIGLLYTAQMWMIKGAFLSMYFGLTRHLTKTGKWVLYLTTAWVVATFFGNTIFQLTYCRPFHTFWSVNPATMCSSIMSAVGTVVTSWTNITGDLAILGIGLYIISGLRVSRREKFAMLIVTGVGTVSIVSTLIRFVLCYRMAIVAGDGALDLIHSINCWSVMELLTAHVAFSMLAFKALLNRRKDAATGKMGNSSLDRSRRDGSRLEKGTMNSYVKHKQDGIHVRHSFDMETLNKTNSSHENLKPVDQNVGASHNFAQGYR